MIRRLAVSAALLALVVARPSSARGDEPWAVSFPPDRVSGYVDGQPVMMVVAGGTDGEARSCADALAEALRRSGRVRDVIAEPVPGIAHPGDGDLALVERAIGLPVAAPLDLIVVVRTVAGGDPGGAVAVFHDRKGEVRVTMTVRRGHAIADRAAEDRYERAFIGFRKVALYRSVRGAGGADTSELAARWDTAYLGRDEVSLDGAALYNAVGRADVATRFERRAQTRRALLIGGGVLLGVGTGVAIGGGVAGKASPFCYEQDLSGTCIDANEDVNQPVLWLGVGLGVGGIAALIAGSSVAVQPISEREAHRLAFEHNQRLRQELGLLPRDEPRCPDAEDRPPALELMFGPNRTPPPPPKPTREQPHASPLAPQF